MSDTKSTVAKNLFWRLAERCGNQGVSFIVSIVLARLLAPEVYGTVALVTVFTTILHVFINSGMGKALVQKKNADQLDFSTLFFFNVVMCLFLYAILFFTAPLIAAFYEMPELTPIVRVIGLTLVIAGLKDIQVSYVSKNLIFKKFFFSTLGATLFSAVVGIGMAYMGYGVWALVMQMLVNELAGTLILWITVPWRPQFCFSFERLKGLFSYGWKLLVSSIIDTVYNDIRQLLIGKLYSSSDLAYYNKGKQFPHLIINTINSSIDSVLLPVMAREQDSASRVKSMVRRSIRTTTYIMAPLMIGLFVCAEPLVRFLLTDKWIDCVRFLRVFCLSYMFNPIHTANLNAIKAMGRSDYILELEIAKKVVGLILLFSTIFISVEAMAYSLLVSTVISTIINAFPNKKLLNYSWFEQMKDILPNISLAILMGIPVFFMQYLPLPTIVILMFQVIMGVIIYIGLSALFKLEMFMYLFTVAKSFWKGKNPHD